MSHTLPEIYLKKTAKGEASQGSPLPLAFVISRNDWIVGKINHNWRITKWISTFMTRKTDFGKLNDYLADLNEQAEAQEL